MKFIYYNAFHLGDNIFHMHFLRKMSELHPHHRWQHYAELKYMDECKNFVSDKPQIEILELAQNLRGRFKRMSLSKVDGYPMNSWVGRENMHAGSHSYLYPRHNEYYLMFYNYLADEIKLESPFKVKDDCLIDHPKILEDNELCYPHDYLIINSQPLSNQFPWEEEKLKTFIIKKLAERGNKIITTRATGIDGVPCTLDYGYNLLQIGSIARYAKKVIAIDTAPLICCFNKWSIETVESWRILSDKTYTYRDNITLLRTTNQLFDDLLASKKINFI